MSNEKQKQPAEKRKHTRLDKNFMTHFRLWKGVDYAGGWQVSPTKDLSLGGCLLTSDKPFKIGDILELDMKIPFLHGQKVYFLGGAARQIRSKNDQLKTYEIGISFMKMEYEKEEEFTRIIKSMCG